MYTDKLGKIMLQNLFMFVQWILQDFISFLSFKL